MKKCSKCKTEKEYANFSKSGKYLNSWCHECKAKSEKEKRIKNGIKPKIKPIVRDDKHKECLKCYKILHINKFNNNRRGRLKKACYCKKCEKKYHLELKNKDPHKAKENHRNCTQKYRNEHREHWRGLHRINQFNRKNKIKAQSDGTVTEQFMKELYATEICCWCHKPTPIENRTAEHVIPLDKGGIHGVSNLKMACLSCNSSKLNF